MTMRLDFPGISMIPSSMAGRSSAIESHRCTFSNGSCSLYSPFLMSYCSEGGWALSAWILSALVDSWRMKWWALWLFLCVISYLSYQRTGPSNSIEFWASEPQVPKWIVNDMRLSSHLNLLSRRGPCYSDVIELFNIHLRYFCWYQKVSMLLELDACAFFALSRLGQVDEDWPILSDGIRQIEYHLEACQGSQLSQWSRFAGIQMTQGNLTTIWYV
jgi:hypothetical protein